MGFSIAKLPAPILRTVAGVAHASARVPGLAPPTIDGNTLDPEIHLGLRAHALAGHARISDLTPSEARAEQMKQSGPFNPCARGPVETRDLRVGQGDVPVRGYHVPGLAPGGPAIVWYHGGGWVIGNIESDDNVCRWIAETTRCRVFSVDYRLAPEHRFPAAPDDALDAWLGLIERADELGFDPSRAAVAGSSAGGNLAAVVTLDCRDRGLPMPARQLLFYPGVDMSSSMPSHRTFSEGFVLDADLIDWFKNHYIGEEDWFDPRASPLFAEDHSGLPPAHVITAGFDPLRDEGRAYADKLERAGVPTTYDCAAGLIHPFFELSGLCTEAARVSTKALLRLADALAAPLPERVPAYVREVPRPRVAVIGAGSSGIASCKALWDAGVPFDCFELSDRVGGNWAFENPNGLSSAYRSLHINTSRQKMAYRDLPMPDDYPDYPHHSLIAAYFDQYVDRFGFRDRIRFRTGVERVEPVDAGAPGSRGWNVTLSDGTTAHYDAVLVANGHHWDPQWPDPPYPGAFDGIQMHSHDYIDPETPHDLRGKRVVVVGFGNSATDIACELSQRGVADRVFLSVRRGAYVLPHYLFGVPTDQLGQTVPSPVPSPLSRKAFAAVFRLAVGRMQDYGLPEPDHEILQAHPTLSSELLPRIGRGDIVPKPRIRELRGDRVGFDDGSEEAVDAIVWCTGYKVSFPFFDSELVSAPDNDLPLYRRTVCPDIPNLYFIGLMQPLGAIMPLAEAQSKWLADVLLGEASLPSASEMKADMERERAAMFRRYVPSRRHTMQVDYNGFLDDVRADHERGRRRVARARAAEEKRR